MTLRADASRLQCAVVGLLLGAAGVVCAQTLPSTAPTSTTPTSTAAASTAPASATPASADRSVSTLPSAQPQTRGPSARLAVTWNGVALRIEATNASLNAVLREVSLKTGMKVTGSAPDERIFGSYGPGPLNLVVPALLNGVAVNLLLTERKGGAADELVLTDRNGAATPSYVPTQQDAASVSDTPPPQPPAYRGRIPSQPPRVARTGGFGGLPPNTNDGVVPDNGVNGRDNGISGPNNGQNGADNGINGRDNGQNGTDNGLNNSNAAANNAATANSIPSTDGSTQASPNGVRTPQEIFEQLQRLRQQQQSQTAPQ